MKRLRPFLFCSFSALLLLASSAARGEAQPNSVGQIVPGVWFREGDIEHEGHCDNVIIEMSDYLVAVDADFPGGARRVMEDARKVSSKPVKYVFDTHHHGGHLYGNPVWTQMGAVTVACQGVADELKRYEPGRWRDTAKPRAGVGELDRTAPEPPRRTFTQSPYVMNDPLRRLEFHFFGWAHTRGGGFVYLPEEKVLCTGDAVPNGAYHFTGDGNIGNWPKVIERAEQLDVRCVLPGHGAPGGREILEGQRQFFIELRNAVRKGVKSGKKAGEIAASLQLPESVNNWAGKSLAAQARDAYSEIVHNQPAGDLPH
jgi:cyclase